MLPFLFFLSTLFLVYFLSDQNCGGKQVWGDRDGRGAGSGWGRKQKPQEQHVSDLPSWYVGESYTEAAAKLPENAAITHWGGRVITESFCPRLPTVISLTARQLRHRIIKNHCVQFERVIFCSFFKFYLFIYLTFFGTLDAGKHAVLQVLSHAYSSQVSPFTLGCSCVWILALCAEQ